VVEHRAHARFRHEPLPERCRATAARVDDLDRDQIAEPSAARTKDLSHAAYADPGFDSVPPVQNIARPELPHGRILRHARGWLRTHRIPMRTTKSRAPSIRGLFDSAQIIVIIQRQSGGTVLDIEVKTCETNNPYPVFPVLPT